MATLDIRFDGEQTVDTILFASSDDIGADKLTLDVWHNGKRIIISDAYSESCVNVQPEDVHNLIKALQKAVLLGWATE